MVVSHGMQNMLYILVISYCIVYFFFIFILNSSSSLLFHSLLFPFKFMMSFKDFIIKILFLVYCFVI